MDAVEGQASQAWRRGDDGLSAEDVDIGDKGEQYRPVVQIPRRVFPELIAEEAEEGEEQVYEAAAEVIVAWREAWAERRSAPHTLDWLRADRRRLELELRLIGVFGLTPPLGRRALARTATRRGNGLAPASTLAVALADSADLGIALAAATLDAGAVGSGEGALMRRGDTVGGPAMSRAGSE